jgi:hypothetical protein
MLGNVRSFLQDPFDRFIHPRLPKKIGVFNGVAVKDQVPLLNDTDVFPNYESSICSSLRTYINFGDDILIVGGGLGVTTVLAGELAGSEGHVRTYEGSASQYERVCSTVQLNRVQDRTDVRHATVGRYRDESEEKYGPTRDADRVDIVSLPKCDVLELDCEGAEIEILSNLCIHPEYIIVETHRFLGASLADVKQLLTELGYSVLETQTEVANKGIYVVVARRE